MTSHFTHRNLTKTNLRLGIFKTLSLSLSHTHKHTHTNTHTQTHKHTHSNTHTQTHTKREKKGDIQIDKQTLTHTHTDPHFHFLLEINFLIKNVKHILGHTTLLLSFCFGNKQHIVYFE